MSMEFVLLVLLVLFVLALVYTITIFYKVKEMEFYVSRVHGYMSAMEENVRILKEYQSAQCRRERKKQHTMFIQKESSDLAELFQKIVMRRVGYYEGPDFIDEDPS